MAINEKIQKAINKQVNAELYSSYLYLSMSAHFAAQNWPGIAAWLKVQAKEENGHAMKLYEYLLERGGVVEFAAIEAPKREWKSALAAFQDVYAHELKITALLNDLLKTAKKEDDTATQIMLQYITEQVEEEANASVIVEQLKRIGDSTNGLFMFDHQIGKRKEG